MSQQIPFIQKKQHVLKAADLSPKGSVDTLCLPIINLINKHADMFTTSSCSGRLSVFVEGEKIKRKPTDSNNDDSVVKLGGKGLGGDWLFITHDVNEVDNWLGKLYESSRSFTPYKPEVNAKNNLSDASSSTCKNHVIIPHSSSDPDSAFPPIETQRLVLYKFEPFILHVKCRNFETASKLYNVAMSCGFRESGIGSNFIVGIRINIKLDLPIGCAFFAGDSEHNNFKETKLQLLLDNSYINSVLNPITKSKFDENLKKINELYHAIEKEMFVDVNNAENAVKETKTERRERKRREGLQRQAQFKQNDDLNKKLFEERKERKKREALMKKNSQSI
ncbi:related to tRNA wybutosine-synthesizing protein 3 [Saccharomycodes ludwigii]|uniref:tRNA wybutosine-synthesizing protein 3 n=1 Tax=Saccharomycodes ludwigii TaxID=36035 RepID=A0A376B2Z9_9ASCO|nr:hypothetical protein SCDLUD_001555 [Saccharomycodes ludwigii]KAH3901777.1 hypothetical protein SCDLUD_001555 [Saccharomycodes ludwigii]SSD58979.1 related to tRNA wybutosine-synthesizing protein 3 [Saccharomycodes ludwigii]